MLKHFWIFMFCIKILSKRDILTLKRRTQFLYHYINIIPLTIYNDVVQGLKLYISSSDIYVQIFNVLYDTLSYINRRQRQPHIQGQNRTRCLSVIGFDYQFMIYEYFDAIYMKTQKVLNIYLSNCDMQKYRQKYFKTK